MAPIYPRLWRYCLAQTGKRDRADDLAQKTCLRALEKHESYQVGTHLDRWLFRMAHRLWLNEIRATAVRTGGGLVALEETEIPDSSVTAEENIFLSEVFTKIGALPEGQRVVVLLAYVEGFTYQETADTLGIPIGTVMSRLASARKKVAGALSASAVEAGV
ncbi:RNA polymerase sigma factor [Phaeobacter sp. B1627]|nr:RNA polymerase sigma factor [Phaeobacter sp. B1627]